MYRELVWAVIRALRGCGVHTNPKSQAFGLLLGRGGRCGRLSFPLPLILLLFIFALAGVSRLLDRSDGINLRIGGIGGISAGRGEREGGGGGAVPALPFGDGLAVRTFSFHSVEALIAARPNILHLCASDGAGVCHFSSLSPTFGSLDTGSSSSAMLEMPAIVSSKHAFKLLSLINTLGEALKAVVFHGFLPNSDSFARTLRLSFPSVKIAYVLAAEEMGAASGAGDAGKSTTSTTAPISSAPLQIVANAMRRGDVDRVAFVTSTGDDLDLDLDLDHGELASMDDVLSPFPPFVPTIPHDHKGTVDGKTHIAVLGRGGDRSNIAAEIIAVCRLPEVVVHTFYAEGAEIGVEELLKQQRRQQKEGKENDIEAEDDSITSWIDVNTGKLDFRRCTAPIISHGVLPRLQMMFLLSSLDLSIHVTPAEEKGGGALNDILLSIASAVPCIIGPAHKIVYAPDPELSSALLVGGGESDGADEDSLIRRPSVIRAHVLYLLSSYVSLSYRVKGIAPYLYRSAEAAWKMFLARLLESKGFISAPTLERQGRRGSASEASGGKPPPPLSTAPYVPWRLIEESYADVPGGLQPIAAPNSGSSSIAFLTAELAPTTAGGAGVVTASLALELLRSGYSVSIIARMKAEEVEDWKKYAETQVDSAAIRRLHVYHVGEVVAKGVVRERQREEEEEGGSREPEPDLSSLTVNHFMLQTLEFAKAVRAAYDDYPFDLLEVFDYAGAGYEILRARRAAARGDKKKKVKGKGKGKGAEGASVESDQQRRNRLLRQYQQSVREYLPSTVPIWVRLHGSIHLIESWEGHSINDDWRTRQMFHMERFVFETADALLPQSKSMSLYYSTVYKLDPSRMLLAPPPMHGVLQELSDVEGPAGAQTDEEKEIEKAAKMCAEDEGPDGGAPGCRLILVFGKMQALKGTETVAAAVAKLYEGSVGGTRKGEGTGKATLPAASTSASLPSMRVVFVGTDQTCRNHWPLQISECVHAGVGEAGRSRVHLVRGISHSRVLWMVRRLRPVAAVVASYFETFNLAAHELSYLGVPIVASDIPAFRDFFLSYPDARFISGNATALAVTLAEVIGRRTLPTYPPPIPVDLDARYPSATAVYDTRLPPAIMRESFQRDLLFLERGIEGSL